MLELLESRWLPNNLLSAWQSPFPDAHLPPALATPVEEPLLLLNPIPAAAPAPPLAFNPTEQIVAPSAPAPNTTSLDVSPKQPTPAASGIDDPLAQMLAFWAASPPASRAMNLLAGVQPASGGAAAPTPSAVQPLPTTPQSTATSSTPGAPGSDASAGSTGASQASSLAPTSLNGAAAVPPASPSTAPSSNASAPAGATSTGSAPLAAPQTTTPPPNSSSGPLQASHPAASAPAGLSPIIAVGSDAGAAPLVKVFDARTGQEKFQFLAYDPSFTGGVRVAAADLNGDGLPDIITAPGPGMAPEVKVFDGKTGVQLAGSRGDFLAYDASFQGGVFVAAGDVNGDGVPDIVAGPGAGGGSEVRAFSGQTGALLNAFAAFGPGYQAGVTVAADYWPGVAHAYVVAGTGPGAVAEIRTFDGKTGAQVPGPAGDLQPFGPDFRGGVSVATGDLNGDRTPDVIAGAGWGHAPEVKAFSGATGAVLQDFLTGDPTIRTGVRVASTYVAGDTHEDIVTAGGPGSAPQVNVYSGATGQLLPAPEGGFLAEPPSQRDGLFVAAAIDPTVTVTITQATQEVLVGGTVSITVAWNSDLPPGTTGSNSGVDWGDGASDIIFPDGPSGHVDLKHTYTSAATDSVLASIGLFGPGGGGAGSAAGVVTVNPPPSPQSVPDDCSCTCTGGALLVNAPGNAGPNGRPWTKNPLRYADGVVKLGAADLSSAGFGVPWGQGRSWTNGPGYAAGGDNGNGWVDTQTPRLLQADGSTNTTIIAVSNGTTARYFDLVGGAYQPRFYDKSALVHNTGTQEFVLTDANGNQHHFADFTSTLPPAEQGVLKSFVDPDGNATSVVSWSPSGQPAEVQRSTTSGGNTIVDSYLYSYLPAGTNGGLLQSVTLRRQTNGGAWSTVRQVQYTYYDGVQSYGNLGDLQKSQVLDASNNVLDTRYYRYYTSADAGSIGYVGGLKYAFGPESYARLVTALGSTAPTSATDSQVSAYADNYFEYDSRQRVTKEIAQGAGCSSCAGGLGTFTYAYTSSTNAAGFNSWATKTVETLPDGNQNTVYTNAYAEVMLRVYHDATSGLNWETFYKYDGLGHVILEADPSAVTGYDDTKADLLNSQSGLYQYLSNTGGKITLFDYYTTTTAGETTAGGAAGYLQDAKLEQGQQGTPILQETWQYFAHTAGGATINPVAADTVYRNSDGTGAETTSYAYIWFAGTTQAQQETVTAPVVSAAQNGPGAADATTMVFDAYGRTIWTKDADGFLRYTAYDAATGAVTKTIQDVNTADTGDFTNLPSGWTPPAGGGLELITQTVVDALGRPTQVTSPAGNTAYLVYLDPQYEVRVYPGFVNGAPTGPTQVIRDDRADSYTETFTISAAPHLTGGVPDGTEAISGLQTLSRAYVNAAGQTTTVDSYFNLSGLAYTTAVMGTVGVNFYQTQLGYDERGRQNRVLSPTGTITRTVYDGLDRVVSRWVGTNDTPASGYWSPTNNTAPSNMVQIAGFVYDGGGVGDGNLTQATQYPGGGAANRVTQNWFDWRDRPVATKSGVQGSESDGTHRPILYVTYDNLNEAVQMQRFDGDGVTLTTVNGVPQPPAANLLRAQAVTAYDDQGRVYRTQVFDVNPTTGAVSTTALTTNAYYDHRGDLIAASAPGGLWRKSQYDGAGREVTSYITDGAGGTTWTAAGSVANDTVLEQSQTVYDADSNVIETIARQRFHNATGTGALGTPTTGVGARVYYAASYYDNADRLTATVNVGTNGGTAWTRPTTAPAPSDTALVTTYAYNAAGWVQDATDPRGLVTRTLYDNLGRTTKSIADYTGGTPGAENDVATEYTYDGDNHVLTVQADQPGGAYQRTAYVYGVTTAGGSGVNSNDILSAIQHPDPTTGNLSSSQQDSYKVNALGQTIQATDRNGSVHQYAYDVLGRVTSDAVTTLGAGVDGAVRRIQTAYDSQGNAYLVTSYDAATAGNIVNQVQRTFNGLRQLTAEYQSHSGAVNVNTTPAVQYAYVELSGGNNSRLTSLTYPSGYVLNYNYTGFDSGISRLTSLSDSGGTLESYKYLGLATVVERDRPQSNVNLTYVKQGSDPNANGDGGDQYTGLDRFGRVIDQNWFNTATSASTDRFQYGYDRDSNALYRQNLANAVFSELYAYDPLNQLTSFQRGTLNAMHNGLVGNPTHSQSWAPDALGNFTGVTTDGATQTRTHNQQNEITSISGQGAVTYDANGNTTADGSGNTFVYDAWNRLVAVKNGGNTLASYGYNVLSERITETQGGTTTDLYYSSSWQVVEERVGGVTQTKYVWSPVYVDALILRDQSGQRLYVQQDANWNVTALVDASGNVLERYVQDASARSRS
jgi:YD repeat-containing protein